MKVIEATEMGMCFGVRDALEIAFARPDARDITVWGELVHNEAVLARLARHGYRRVAETPRRELPETPKLLVTAHGISDRERKRLEAAGKRLIDTTCPLVARVHESAKELERSGHHVIVLGRPGHVEVRGNVCDLSSISIVASASDVRTFESRKLGVVAQSTFVASVAREIVAAIERHNPGASVVWRDTICDPTKRRVRALDDLLSRVDAIVVVGGRNSNNTKQLVRSCEDRSIPAWHVQGAGDLDPRWFDGSETVGLTAGTSTLDTTIAEVRDALRAMPTRRQGSARELRQARVEVGAQRIRDT